MSKLAAAQGTRRYAERVAATCVPEHFRELPSETGPLRLSSLGLGSYTGPVTEAADRQYQESVMAAVRHGVNVIDCAINYRHMRSERALGAGLRELFASGEAARDEVFIMTKAGYLPFDGSVPPSPQDYFRTAYRDTGIVRPGELVANSHCIAPAFLEDQLGRSLRNFGLDAVDVFFLHNVEQQLDEVAPDAFYERVEAAFAFLEKTVADGRVGMYGVATWNGFRVPQESPGHLSLERLVAAAVRAGGEANHFRVLQLPYNLGMSEALGTPTQGVQGGRMPLLEAASHYGLMVVTSVPLLQTQLLAHVPPNFAAAMPGLATAAQRALQFVRSTPGVFAPLVGMRNPAHVVENCVLTKVAPMSAGDFLRLLGR